jgi:hypothetical protein
VNGKDRIYANGEEAVAEGLVSRFPDNGNANETSRFPSGDRDQNCQKPRDALTSLTVRREALGEPLAIEQVADLLGCSAWTVRQRYLRQGLPHLQARPRGKLVFFREQVIAWIEKRQRQKGGILR